MPDKTTVIKALIRRLVFLALVFVIAGRVNTVGIIGAELDMVTSAPRINTVPKPSPTATSGLTITSTPELTATPGLIAIRMLERNGTPGPIVTSVPTATVTPELTETSLPAIVETPWLADIFTPALTAAPIPTATPWLSTAPEPEPTVILEPLMTSKPIITAKPAVSAETETILPLTEVSVTKENKHSLIILLMMATVIIGAVLVMVIVRKNAGIRYIRRTARQIRNITDEPSEMRGELQELIGKSRHFVRSADVHPSDFSKTVRLVYRALRIIEAIEESGTSEAVANAREQGRLCYGVLDRLLKIKENKRENSYSVIVGVQTAFILNECEAKRRSLQNAEKAYC